MNGSPYLIEVETRQAMVYTLFIYDTYAYVNVFGRLAGLVDIALLDEFRAECERVVENIRKAGMDATLKIVDNRTNPH